MPDLIGTPKTLHLRFQGDWGGVNLTRICGWIAGELYKRAGPGTNSTIRTGRGMGDNLLAVGRGEVDVAVSTPAGFAVMARQGQGLFASEPLPGLRAIGSLPHNDAMMVAIPARLDIRSFAELRDQKPSLRLTLSPNDGVSFMGFAAAEVLRAARISFEDIVDWGGKLIFREQPQECVADVMSGKADAIIHEAIMTSWWHEMAEAHTFSFLSLEDAAASSLYRDFSIGSVNVPAAHFRGMNEPVRAVDFRDWMVIVREDMEDDIAGLLTSILCETSELFERQYAHIPVALSPLDYPITPQRLAAVPIPLHPGAAAYYRTIGVAIRPEG